MTQGLNQQEATALILAAERFAQAEGRYRYKPSNLNREEANACARVLYTQLAESRATLQRRKENSNAV